MRYSMIDHLSPTDSIKHGEVAMRRIMDLGGGDAWRMIDLGFV